MSFHLQTTMNPSAAATSAILRGSQLNNQALEAERDGDLLRAESLHLEAIAIKEKGVDPDAVSTALSRNALGELYIKLGRVDDAEVNLKKAVAIRNHAGPAFDAAVSRENLAQLYEIRENLKLAKETRLYGAPDNLSCGYYHVCIFSITVSVTGDGFIYTVSRADVQPEPIAAMREMQGQSMFFQLLNMQCLPSYSVNLLLLQVLPGKDYFKMTPNH